MAPGPQQYTGNSIVPEYIRYVQNSVRTSTKCFPNQYNIIQILTCEDLIEFIHNPPRICPDVFIILGHSNIFNFGTISISDMLCSFLETEQLPTIIAFLGCCGALPRFGPLPMLANHPKFKNTLLSFYQRRVYEDEVMSTALVKGIGNYLRLSNLHPKVIPKTVAIHSFAVGFVNQSNDSSTYLNIDHTILTVQMLFDVLKDISIDSSHIPPSCLQLALFHTYIHGIYPHFNKFVQDLKSTLSSTAKPAELVLDEKCKGMIQEFKIHWIYVLATKLQLLTVSPKTLDYLYNGQWKNVDSLQFFIAILNGYWGKNHANVIRECAVYHLENIMQKFCIHSDCDFKAGFVAFDVPQSATHHCNIDNEILHKYHLCCVAYCMLSRCHFIYFPKDNAYKRFGFCLRSNFCSEYVVTPKGLLSLRKYEDIPRIEAELYWPWVKSFSKCPHNDQFFKLHNSPDTTFEISNYRTDPEKKKDLVFILTRTLRML